MVLSNFDCIISCNLVTQVFHVTSSLWVLSSSSWRLLELSLAGRGRASYFQVIEAETRHDGVDNSELQDERNCELCSRQATNEFFSQEYLLRSRYFSFLFSFLYIKSEFFFSFTLFFHETSNYNEVFYPILTRRECCCSYEKRFYTLLYSWKSINRLKLSRDILYWIASYQIYYFLDFI